MSTDAELITTTGFHTVAAAADTRRLPVLEKMLLSSYEGPLVVGTLDMTTDDGREMYFLAAGAVDIDREMACEDYFPVCSWVAEVKANIAAEGEPAKPGVRVTLFGPQGETFAFAGVVPHDSFGRIRAVYGDGPWTPPLWLKGKEVKTSKGRSTYILTARSVKPEGK